MRLPSIYVGPSLISELDRALRLEWIVTNGLGGYSSSTVLGVNTRKYHGLLVASLNPPVDRHLLLAKLDEEVKVGRNVHALASNEIEQDRMEPEGYRYLTCFSMEPFPTLQYEIDGVYIKKLIFMPNLKNAVISTYSVLNSLGEPVDFRVYPLVGLRHIYTVRGEEAGGLGFHQRTSRRAVYVGLEGLEWGILISSTRGCYTQHQAMRRLYFRVDASRGEASTDVVYQPGSFTVRIKPGVIERFHITASLEPKVEGEREHPRTISSEDVIEELYREELERRRGILRTFSKVNPDIEVEDWLGWLLLSADSFLVFRRTTGGRSVIAGYHWFGDWGRDSLISLPGLTLITGRFGDAREILLTFKRYCKDGLIPNSFPDRAGENPTYDSVDSSLWFVNAVLQYLKYTGDFDFVYEELWGTLRSIIDSYIEGTSFGIRMDDDGLIAHGPRLTWMDVAVGGRPITPREGKAVEVQALWYNSLKAMEALATKFGQLSEAGRYSVIAERARRSFNEEFIDEDRGYLFDVLRLDGSGDPTFRPNQILSVSLDFAILERGWMGRVVNAVWRRLWGVYGLRTLPSDDPRYRGRYIGGWLHRENAYHNGTVWAWLLGPFVTAFLKVHGYGDRWRRFAYENFMKPLLVEEVYRVGLGCVSEIFDGDPPNEPRGCISQAWSVAEPLRALVEDVHFRRPPFEGEVLGILG